MTTNERRQAIIFALIRRKKETMANFAFEFGVSKRTIGTDIMCLSSTEPIYTVAGRGGGIRIDENYVPDIKFFTAEQADLILRIRPHLSEEQYSYADAKELTGAFNIKKEKSAFTLTMPQELTLKEVLEKVYGKTVEVEEPSGYLYTLVVSSYNEKVTYKINFGISIDVEGIELDKDSIIFGGGGEEQGGSPSVPSKPDEPSNPATEYAITYEIAYSFDDTPITVECPTKARAGETVNFTAIPERKYEDYGVWAEVYDAASGEFLYYATTVSYGCCNFEMPACNAHLKIYHV